MLRTLMMISVLGLALGCDDSNSAPERDTAPDTTPTDGSAPDGGADSGADASADAAVDGAVDAASDSAIDVGADVPLDAAIDSQIDAEPDAMPDAALPSSPLTINELMPKNEGAWVDEVGQLDDWIELLNQGELPLDLSGFSIGDREDEPNPLPAIVLEPGERLIIWADDDLDQGPLHMPFKLSSGGESLYLWQGGLLVEVVTFDELGENVSWQRIPDGGPNGVACEWPTPSADNGDACGPPAPPEIPDDVIFAPYQWSDPWPFPPTPLVMSEIALRPAGFVEIINVSDGAVDPADVSLRLSPHSPGEPWPTREEGIELAWPNAAPIAPGARVVVSIEAAQTAALEADPLFEGVISLWLAGRNFPLDRVDFMHWPAGAALTRMPDTTGRHRFCASMTRGAPNAECDPLASRDIGDRLRHLRTPGDFAALAEGGVATGIASVKFVIDMQGGDATHLLGARRWDLHYTFVRENIDHDPPLSRCDVDENRVFTDGWRQFSRENYTEVETRRYLLGTLVHHGGANIYTHEHTAGDNIIAAQIRRAFFATMNHVQDPQRFSVRAQSGRQTQILQEIEGTLPIVGPNAPFQGVTYQPLTTTVGYGVLTYVPVHDLESAALGSQVIVVTDQVPNDIALTGGLITEAFQTPLAHVNLLSRNRNTPNMALLNAREDPRLAPFLGQLVRLEVGPADFNISVADPAEATAFWDSRRPDGPPLQPRSDLTVRGVVPLAGRGIEDLPSVGAKAAQLAELGKVDSRRDNCLGSVTTPLAPMAIPLVHSLEHYDASGARARLDALELDPDFVGNPLTRAAGLAEVRDLVLAHPVDPALLVEVEAYMLANYAGLRVRFRSSSNTEDLPGFNGAGLYTSISAELGDDSRRVDDAIRTVWASLFLSRGYDERAYGNIDQGEVAMAVLVHPAFLDERANGVGISRNILDPLRDDAFLNIQRGEASVTNPAPGVATEQVVYTKWRTPRLNYIGRSSLVGADETVLSREEVERISCTLWAIHTHFRPLIDPTFEDLWFAMDIEFKFLGAERRMLVKQARPYSFGAAEVPMDCRRL